MSEAGLGDIVRLDKIVKWFKTIWAKSFFVVVGTAAGFFAGQAAIEWRIIGDCKYLNSFRIDHLSYTCNRKVNEQ